TSVLYTLSLHDALPIFQFRPWEPYWQSPVWSFYTSPAPVTQRAAPSPSRLPGTWRPSSISTALSATDPMISRRCHWVGGTQCSRSEEHTSELQSHLNLV